MSNWRIRHITTLVILGSLAAACSFGPPPSCGDEIGGTADTATFDQYFNSMTLVAKTTGQPGPQGDAGPQFAQGEPLAIQVDARAEVTLRACIQPMGGQKEISFDKTQTLSPGLGTFELGPFEPGTYVIRVIIGNTLVKNFPFQVR